MMKLCLISIHLLERRVLRSLVESTFCGLSFFFSFFLFAKVFLVFLFFFLLRVTCNFSVVGIFSLS